MEGYINLLKERIIDSPHKQTEPSWEKLLTELDLTEQTLREDEATRWHTEVEGRWPHTPHLQNTLVWNPIINLITGDLNGTRIEPSSSSISGKSLEKFKTNKSNLLTVPPGFERGVHFDTPLNFQDLDDGHSLDNKLANEMVTAPTKTISVANILLDLPSIDHDASESDNEYNDNTAAFDVDNKPQHYDKQHQGDVPSTQQLDALLSTIPTNNLAQSITRSKTSTTASWAYTVNPHQLPIDYDQVIGTEPTKYFTFPLDLFQKQAIYHLERGDNVFVAAHTSAGKTVVAEWAILKCQKHFTKAIYTSPIKALSNQKFRDFRSKWGEDAVGLVTGDVQVNPGAGILLVMTTEILRSMLYRQAEVLGEIEVVIFDEVHYINDADRGVVWEEVIIMLPPTVQLVMLSATIPNTIEFASWVGRTHRGRPVYVISTSHRPVPLEHYLYAPTNNEGSLTQPLLKIVDAQSRFLEESYREALKRRQRGRPTYGMVPTASYKGQWMDVIYLLKKKNLLPVVAFTFSRRQCEENVASLANLDLTTASEKSAIHLFLEHAITTKLKPIDRQLPQILRVREMLGRGLAIHHSGLLPLLKEAVEILFGRGLVRVLFATETFAMGVNMPARTVLFSSLTKHDGLQRRLLLPTEYTQMAGRAGRRGIDSTGTVIILAQSSDSLPSDASIKTMILGRATKLVSQFRLTYSMILNLLRVQALRIEEMIKASFSEHAGQMELPQEEERWNEIRKLLDTTPTLDCSLCAEIPITEYYELATQLARTNTFIYRNVLEDPKLVARLLEPGRWLIARFKGHNVPAVLLRVMNRKELSIFLLQNVDDGDDEDDKNQINNNIQQAIVNTRLPPLPPLIITTPNIKEKIYRKTMTIELDCLVDLLEGSLMVPPDLGSTTIYRAADLDAIQDAMIAYLGTLPRWRPLELPSFKSLDLEERRILRHQLVQKLSLSSMACPQLEPHLIIFHRRSQLVEQLAELEFQLSDASLSLLPEYRARLELLCHLKYVDAQGMVTIKGRVAGELATVHELLVTELLFENAFVELKPAEIIALLSSLVFQDRITRDEEETDNPSEYLTGNLLIGWQRMVGQAKRLTRLAQELGVVTASNFSNNSSGDDNKNETTGSIAPVTATSQHDLLQILRPALIETVYGWANGLPFVELMQRTDVLEGSIVRCIVRLDETCRELKGAARIMGDPILAAKMEEASRLIKRDICFAASLYI